MTYEIVTGTRPYETSGKTLDDVLEMVLETEPTRPSAIRSGDDTPGAAPVSSRATQRRSRRRRPQGDEQTSRTAIRFGGRVGRRSRALPDRPPGCGARAVVWIPTASNGGPQPVGRDDCGGSGRGDSCGARCRVVAAERRRSVADPGRTTVCRNAAAGQYPHLQDSRRDCSARGVDTCTADDRYARHWRTSNVSRPNLRVTSRSISSFPVPTDRSVSFREIPIPPTWATGKKRSSSMRRRVVWRCRSV